MTAKVLFIPFGGGSPAAAPACFPLLKNIGSALGAAYGADVVIPDGAQSHVRGLSAGGIFAGLKNLSTAENAGGETVLVSIEDGDSRTLAIVYKRHEDAPYGRLAMRLNGEDVLSMPAPVDTHPVLIAVVCIPTVPDGPAASYALVAGASDIVRKEANDGEWPVAANMTVLVGQASGGGRTEDAYETGGVFVGVPPIPYVAPDPVALALTPVSLSGKLDDIVALFLGARVWVANALKADASLDPWPELNGGTGLARLPSVSPTFYTNCTPAWATSQMPASGRNLGGGFNILNVDKSQPSVLALRSLTSGGGINIQQLEDTIFLSVTPVPGDFAALNFSQWNGGNWVLPKDNAVPVVVPGQLVTAMEASTGFSMDAGGAGGRTIYNADADKFFRVTCSSTVVRPPAVSLDARGQFYLGRKLDGELVFTPIAGSQQWKRLNIIDCDDVITVETIISMQQNTVIALMGTSDAGDATGGLGITIRGYSLTITEV
jgi:hypothetical protein